MQPKFTQLRILTTNFARSFQFYNTTLSLPLKNGSQTGPYACFTLPNSSDIALFDRSAMLASLFSSETDSAGHNVSSMNEPQGAEPGAFVLVLKVDNVEDVLQEVQAKGAEVVKGVTERKEWGLKSGHIRAPEGTLIELCEY
ncbi:hypothetical protein HDV00_008204 [Rhizophlyctis rosea]|nr:hypothetical protein HDV00_008204 [Rhizophlyctis rosea]